LSEGLCLVVVEAEAIGEVKGKRAFVEAVSMQVMGVR
jgi:hypothetical protein